GLVGALAGSVLGLIPKLLASNLWLAYGPSTDLVSWTGDWSWLGAMAGLLLGVVSAATVGYDELPEPSAELGRLVKRTIIGVLISSATFGLAGWAVVRYVFTVQMVEPEWVRQLQTAMTDEMMAPIAPGQNGYVVLGPVLDREASQARKAPYLVLADFYQANLESLPPELVGPVGRAAPTFEAVLPQIREAVARPEYSSMAVYGYGPEAPMPDLQTERGIVKGLVVLGLYRQSQGDLQGALDAYLLGLNFGTRESGAGVLVHEMVCVNNVNDVCGPLTGLANSGQLSPDQWRQLAAGLEACGLDPLHFGRAMDHEYLAVLRLFDQNTSDEFKGTVPAFLLEGERTIYTNLFFGHRNSFYSLNSTASFEEARARFPFSIVMPSLLPNIKRAQTGFCEALTRLEGLRTMAALEAFRQQRGHYPEQLEQLERPAFDYLAPRKKNRQAVSGPYPGQTEPERLGSDDLPTLAYERDGTDYHLASLNQDWSGLKWPQKGVFR
ncbi:MAG: hypothetical protein KC910_02620, partial [Candidatus Eremiobacteraeota bacterium]|nr:hypothetical protein [Candidatus Eremiobacteraeota bacterium]